MIVWDTEVEMLSALAFAPDGRELALAGWGKCGTFSVPDGARLRTLPLSYSQRLWYDADGLHSGPMLYLPGESEPVERPADGPQGERSADGRVRVSLSTETTRRPVTTRDRRGRTRQEQHTTTIHILRGHERTADGWADRWEVRSEQAVADILMLSADGRFLATGQKYGDGFRVWDAGTGKVLHTHPAARVVDIRFDGDRLLAFSRSHLFVWDANDWNRPPLSIYGGKHERLDDMALHPDGRRAYLTNFARTMLVVDLHTGTVQTTMDWGVPLLSKVAVSADGTLAAAANHGGQVVLWDLDP